MASGTQANAPTSSHATAGSVPLLRSMWLLTRLRLRRLINQMTVVYSRRRSGPKVRAATAGKRRNPWLVTGFEGVTMLLTTSLLSRQGILNFHHTLDSLGAIAATADYVPVRKAYTLEPGAFSDLLSRALTMELSLLFLVVVLMTLGTRELAHPDWDLEWLVTLPSPKRAMLWSRVVERSFTNPTGIVVLWPTCLMIAWYSGYRWSAPLLAVAVVIPLLLLTAVARTVVDTGWRLSLSPSRLRNLQAAISVLSILLLYLAMSPGMQAHINLVFDLARQFPSWSEWLPPGLALRALNAQDALQGLIWMLMLMGETALLVYSGVSLLEHQLRNGVVAASSRESARRAVSTSGRSASSRPASIAKDLAGQPVSAASTSPGQVASAPGAPPSRSAAADSAYSTPRGLARFLTAIQRRELTLLSRDRNYLVQTLVLPVIIICGQLFFTGRLQGIGAIGASSAVMASIGFGIAAYVLMLSAFQTLNSEGKALWILYTVPRSLQSVLYEKVQLWSALALIFPAAVFAIGISLGHRIDLQLVGLAGIVLLGVPIYAAIGMSLGVFGCDPLAQDVQTRLRPTYVYLYMLLSGLYTYAILASQWWQKGVLIVLSGLLAVSLWQKARDQFPFLLDPAASPPARVSVSDGVIAAMLFFVFQGAAALVVGRGAFSGFKLMVVFSIAGAMTYAAVRFTYWRSKTQGVPTILGTRSGHGSAAAGDVSASDTASASNVPPAAGSVISATTGGVAAAVSDVSAAAHGVSAADAIDGVRGHAANSPSAAARATSALAWGSAAGLTAGLAGILYLYSARHLGFLDSESSRSLLGGVQTVWFVLLAVLAAPLFEEFIFRGLIFGGLRRSMSATKAILASAAVFAIVHPPISMIPVFALGLCAAIAYDRTRILLAPMAAHALYNAMVLAYQLG